MKSRTPNRRQFLTETGKAGIALASLPLFTKMSSHTFYNGSDFTQQPLPFSYTALEPYIDSMTMEIHYTKHAATYAKNLADACVAEKVDTTTTSLTTLLKSVSKYTPKMRNIFGS